MRISNLGGKTTKLCKAKTKWLCKNNSHLCYQRDFRLRIEFTQIVQAKMLCFILGKKKRCLFGFNFNYAPCPCWFPSSLLNASFRFVWLAVLWIQHYIALCYRGQIIRYIQRISEYSKFSLNFLMWMSHLLITRTVKECKIASICRNNLFELEVYYITS